MNILELKYNRFSEHEIFLLNIFSGLEEYENDACYDSILYKKDGDVMFEYNLNTQFLWYSHKCIWLVFVNKFEIKTDKINRIVQSMVEEYLKIRVNTTDFYFL